MSDLEHTIRARAYELWLASGGGDGRAEQHWLEAQREILSASLGTVARVTAKTTTKQTSAPRKKRRAA